jgi:hypothetical protein
LTETSITDLAAFGNADQAAAGLFSSAGAKCARYLG